MSYKNKTVLRSMEILNLFLDHEELTFQEIIDLSGMPKTSVYRMVSSLETMGFLEKGNDLKYRLGLIFLKFGSLVSSRIDIRRIAYPLMRELHDDVEEAINLSIRQNEEDETIYIEKIDLKQKVRVYTAVGRRSPLYAGASSRAILAFQSDAMIKEYIERTEFVPFAKGTITDKKEFLRKIEETRENGYAVSHSELHDYTSEVAAPIYDYKGNVVASLSIVGMEANFHEENIKIYAKKLLDVTERISAQLDYKKEETS
jgi:IclR family KDG regulon transcriptional repressor